MCLGNLVIYTGDGIEERRGEGGGGGNGKSLEGIE